MKHVAYIALVLPLALLACENTQLSAPDGGSLPPLPDAAPPMGGTDGEPPQGGEMPTGGMNPMDSGLGAGGVGGGDPMGGDPMGGAGGSDPMGGDPGFGGISGVGGAMVTPGVTQCAVPGRSLTASTTVPEYGEATAVFDGADIHFFWFEKSDVEVQDDNDVGAPGVYQCTLGTDGLFRGAAVPVSDDTGQVDALDGLDAVNVVSARVRGTPWVAYGGDTLPIRVFQAHRVSTTLTIFDGQEGRPHLVGKPLVVAAGRDLMVFGRTPPTDEGSPGSPAWIRITAELELPAQLVDQPELRLPTLDAVVAVRGGLLARSSEAGQCVFIGDQDWTPSSNFYCRFGAGGLLSDGQEALLWTRFDFRANGAPVSRVGIWPTYTFNDESDTFYGVVSFEDEALLRFPAYNGLQPIVGERRHDLAGALSNERQSALTLVGVDEWWSSNADPVWTNQAEGRASGWPYFERTRVLATRYPTVTDCPVEVGCVADTLNAVVFEHGTQGPQVGYIPLLQRVYEDGVPYGNPPSPCAPSPEICDGVDNDCDGQIDDGLCCLGELVTQFDFPQDVDAVDAEEIGPITQWLVNPNENGLDYWILYRHEGVGEAAGTSSWGGFKWQIEARTSPSFWARNAPLPFAQLGVGERLHPIGGKAATLMRDDDGVLYLSWTHDTALVKDPVRIPDACQDYLAAGIIRSNQNRESLFLVCEDRMVRYYGHAGWPDLTYYWAEDCPGGCDAQSYALGLDSGVRRISWATVTQTPIPVVDAVFKPDSNFYLTVGYDFDFVPQLKVFRIENAQDDACDADWAAPCLTHCGVGAESSYCNDAEPPFIPDPDDDDAEGEAQEAAWRACSADAVSAKNDCCAALFDQAAAADLLAPDDLADRNSLVLSCRNSIATTDPGNWIKNMPEPDRSAYASAWTGCFKEMAAVKGRCCALSDDVPGVDETTLVCHRPPEAFDLEDSLLLVGASADPVTHYSHPMWVSPYLPNSDQAHAIRSIAQADDEGPLVELAFQGFEDAEGNDTVDWRNIVYGGTPDHLQIAPLSGRVIAARRDEGYTRFRILDTEGDDGKYNLWAMNPSHTVKAEMYAPTEPGGAGQATWAFVEGLSGVRAAGRGPADNTFVEFHRVYTIQGEAVSDNGMGEGDLVVAGVPIRATTVDDDALSPRPQGDRVASAIAVAAAINEYTSETGVEATPNETLVIGGSIEGGALGDAGAPAFRINGVDIVVPLAPGRGDNDVNAQDSDHRLRDAINDQTGLTGVSAAKFGDVGGRTSHLELTAEDGRNILVQADDPAGFTLVTGLPVGITYSGVTLVSPQGVFEVDGEDPLAAGLVSGTALFDRWRISARKVECGGR